jgi:predicted metal-dependent phosphoesterase TrpH
VPHVTVELHSHSCYSHDSLMLPQKMLAVCDARGIDRLAITDHNSITGALEAASLAPQRVIVGEEVQTTKGELLAYFVKELIPAGLDPREAIRLLRQQGALISVPHPLDCVRSGSWRMQDLRSILPLVDALEVFNARATCGAFNRQAEKLAAAESILRTAGSDAHSYAEIGRAIMRMPDFRDAAEMGQALAEATIHAAMSPGTVHFLSRYASLRKRLGWEPPAKSSNPQQPEQPPPGGKAPP